MKAALIFILVVLVLGTLAFSCRDWRSMRSGEHSVVLPAGETHEGWYFAGGNQVSIQGTINGDAYVAGGVVEVEGTINGQLVVAGGQVNVSGNVTDRIFGAGGTVRFTGKTGKSITAAGGTVVIGKDATVGENLLAGGGNIQVNGTVEREARVAGREVELTGAVKGNLDVQAERFNAYRGSLVGGSLSVAARDSGNVSVDSGTVRGTVHIDIMKGEHQARILGIRKGVFWPQVIFGLTLFATALALSFLLPGHLKSPASVLLNQPGQSIIWGFIMLIITPVLALILCLTVIAIPLGLFLFLLYLWFLYTSQLVIGVAVGSRLLGLEGKRGWSLFGAVAIGLLIVQILLFIPVVKIFVVLAGLVVGVGALVIAAKAGMATLRAG